MLLLSGGTVVDGTGSPPRRADVAIDGDRITAVGSDVAPVGAMRRDRRDRHGRGARHRRHPLARGLHAARRWPRAVERDAGDHDRCRRQLRARPRAGRAACGRGRPHDDVLLPQRVGARRRAELVRGVHGRARHGAAGRQRRPARPARITAAQRRRVRAARADPHRDRPAARHGARGDGGRRRRAVDRAGVRAGDRGDGRRAAGPVRAGRCARRPLRQPLPQSRGRDRRCRTGSRGRRHRERLPARSSRTSCAG